MRVLIFNPALAPYRVDFFNSLAERVDLELVLLFRNLRNQKFDQDKLLGSARFRYRYLTRGFTVRGRIVRVGVCKLLREIRPDVVIGFEFSPFTFFLALAQPFFGYKLWTSTDDHAEKIKQTRGLRKWMRRFICRRSKGCIVAASAVAEAMKKALPECAGLLFPISPILHDERMMRRNEDFVFALGKAWRSGLLDCDGEKLLLYVGRLDRVKNLNWLIEQFAAAVPGGCGFPIKLVFVGEGQEHEMLEAKVGELGLEERVVFEGRKEGDELYACMSAADALILCSRSEPYGAVVGEALQWGTPVIVSEQVGAKVLIDEGNGVVFRQDDVGDFVEKLNRVLVLKKGAGSLLRVEMNDVVEQMVAAFGSC